MTRQWIEIVRLVSAPKDVQMLQKEIRAQIDGLEKTPGLERALVMLHAIYGTDFAIVLVWNNEREPVKTREGLLLADGLRQFGSVDHAIWSVLSNVTGSAGNGAETHRDRQATVRGKS